MKPVQKPILEKTSHTHTQPTDVMFCVKRINTFLSKARRLNATGLVCLTTWGTGFTAALWEQSRVPLRTLFGWPLSYVTILKNMLCVCLCGETFGWRCASECSVCLWSVLWAKISLCVYVQARIRAVLCQYLTALWMAMWLTWPLTPCPSKVSTWNNKISHHVGKSLDLSI